MKSQLDFLLWIASFRTPVLDQFFLFLNRMDSEQFLFILIPTIWLGFSYRWGMRIFFLILISGYLNYLLKILFQEPRPFVHIPDLALVHVGQNAFPSGAAQNSFLLAGLLIYALRSKWSVLLGLSYVLIMGFSRLYLGVHYVTDIIGGYIVGLILLLLFIYTHKKFEKTVARWPYLSLSLSIFLPLIIILLFPTINTLHFLSAFIAGAIGVFFSLFYGLYIQNTHKIPYILLRSLIGIALIFMIHMLSLEFLSPYTSHKVLITFQTALMSFWIALFASPLLKLLLPSTRWMNQPVK